MKNIKLFLTKLMVLFIAVFSVNSLAFAGNGFNYDPSGLELFKPENRELVKKLLEDGDNPNTAYVFIELFHKEMGKKFLKIYKDEENGELSAIKDKELSQQEIKKLTPLLEYIYDQAFKSYLSKNTEGEKMRLNKLTHFCTMYVKQDYNLEF